MSSWFATKLSIQDMPIAEVNDFGVQSLPCLLKILPLKTEFGRVNSLLLPPPRSQFHQLTDAKRMLFRFTNPT